MASKFYSSSFFVVRDHILNFPRLNLDSFSSLINILSPIIYFLKYLFICLHPVLVESSILVSACVSSSLSGMEPGPPALGAQS